MDDHFWPSMYPGILIGIIYGFGIGGLRSMLLGAIGGLAGAALAYAAVGWLSLSEGFATLAMSIALAAGLAAALVGVDRLLHNRGGATGGEQNKT